MKAIQVAKFGGPEVLTCISSLALPTPGPQEVLVKVMCAGVNPVDAYIRTGNYVRVPPLPYTPGADAAGLIVKLGSSDLENRFKVNDRVFTSSTKTGSYAEYAVVPANYCYPLSDKLTFQQGASLGVPYFTAYRALFQNGQAKAGDTVLVHGASGAVGLACCQMGAAQGLQIIGTAGTDKGLQCVKEQGAVAAFNHKEEGYPDEIMKFTGGKGVNLVIEMLSNVNLRTDCKLAANKGKILVVGSRGELSFDPRLVMPKELSIIGVALVNSPEGDHQEQVEGILKMIDQGFVKPVVAKEYSLEEASTAHDDVINKTGSCGKLVINTASA